MGDEVKEDRALERLNSMHERIEKLRSQLRQLELGTYSLLAATEEERKAADDMADGVSKNYT